MDIDVAEGETGELPCSRDLLRRFTGTTCSDKPPLLSAETASFSSSAASREMDLCLGLSLGGCFARDKRLLRSSSISDLPVIPTDEDYPPAAAPLARTCSLPVEAEEDHRKRKEIQSLKRLEAKRKREEKKFSRPGSDGELCGGVPPRWGMGAGGVPAAVSPARPAGLWRSSSSFDIGASIGPELPATTNSAEAGKSSSSSSTPETIHKSEPQAAAAISPAPEVLRSLRSLGEDDEAMKRMSARSVKVSKDVESNIMEEMPCVSTKGDGPNGTRIEGFLYKYKKGEEVRIVCVCHGRFLTPAEFIRHAGGGDVEHPLRHIVVNPPSSSSSSSAYFSQ
ncbi:Ninja-family protein AFP3 [Platanthera guangdongensis]|uniref:Ninja-family protein n=1 Tax=Platanthera guangdongensis TaxID=2320717 RepID=A0ABR2MLV4_9ASPA